MMTHPILFSIVIPTYNRAHILPKTIASILSQTYPHFEVIIVDDGSTDNTESVIKNLSSDKIFYYKKENAERAAARNFGTSKAQGDYINWFDSDDLMYPDNLKVAAETIHKNNHPEVIVQGYEEIDSSGNVVFTSKYGANLNLDLYKGNLIGNSPVIVRRDIAFANPYNEDRDLSASEDYELWLRLASQYRFCNSTGTTVSYIYHPNNSTATMTNPDKLIKRYTKFIQYATADKGVLGLLGSSKNYFVMRSYLLLALDMVTTQNKRVSISYLAKSFSKSPKLIFEKGFYAFWKHFFFN